MKKVTIEVRGMHCGMCEAHVNDCLRKIEGVRSASSSHAENKAEAVVEDDVDVETLKAAIASQGYEVGESSVAPYQKKGLFRRLLRK